jgi:hypothetical protein
LAYEAILKTIVSWTRFVGSWIEATCITLCRRTLSISLFQGLGAKSVLYCTSEIDGNNSSRHRRYALYFLTERIPSRRLN